MLLTSLPLTLALLPLPQLSVRRVVQSRAPGARLLAALDVDLDKVVGQVEKANPTDSFGERLYDGKRGLAPIWGGLRVGTRRIVVVTGVRTTQLTTSCRSLQPNISRLTKILRPPLGLGFGVPSRSPTPANTL